MKALRALAILVCLGFSALAQTAASTEDLIKHVLAAIETNSQTDLERLTISEAEYRKYIWPTISANNPVAKFENYYAMYRQGSIYGLTMLLKGLGGQKLQLVKVSPGQLIRQGKGYRLLSTPSLPSVLRVAQRKASKCSPQCWRMTALARCRPIS